MSRSLGPALPDLLLGRLLAPPEGILADAVVVLATVDPYGWPHPALVGYGELLALDAARLRLGIGAGSRSASHLRESGRVTLVFADPELVCYVKAEAVALGVGPEPPGVAAFELQVRDVLQDRAAGEEAAARIRTGLSASWPDRPAAAVRRLRLRALLASAAPGPGSDPR